MLITGLLNLTVPLVSLIEAQNYDVVPNLRGPFMDVQTHGLLIIQTSAGCSTLHGIRGASRFPSCWPLGESSHQENRHVEFFPTPSCGSATLLSLGAGLASGLRMG